MKLYIVDFGPKDRVVFKNTHEAIVDEETWKVVQKIREGKRIPKHLEYFVCAAYRKTKGACTSHRIKNVVIEQLLLEGLQQVIAFAKNHEA